jgi:TPR repeat protein
MTFVLEKRLGLRLVDNNYDFEFAFALFDQKDYDQVWKYALPYANAGDSNAQCLISLLLQHGFGVLANLDEAERWLRLAAQQNNGVAWNNLGTLLLSKGEKEEAKRCYQRAVELGFTMAKPLAGG